MLKAGRTGMGARAASSHTGALAGNDKIYDDVLRQSGVIRAKSLRDLLDFARGDSDPAHAQGRERGHHHRRRRLGRAAVRRLRRQRPDADGRCRADLDAAFRKFIPPFGAAGNPVDITGGEPPKTYQNTVRLGLGGRRASMR